MKLIYKLLLICAVITAGWYSPYYLSGFLLPSTSCDFNTYYLYADSPQRMVVHSRLLGEYDGKNWRYSAKVTPLEGPEPALKYHAEYLFTVKRSFMLRHHTVTTVWSYPLFQSADSEAKESDYLDPFTNTGFRAPVYIFHAGSKWMVGFKDRPRYICESPRV
ncbi:TPA: hypothetical protein ACNFPD_004430 [Enterobacter cancerogenus]